MKDGNTTCEELTESDIRNTFAELSAEVIERSFPIDIRRYLLDNINERRQSELRKLKEAKATRKRK